MSMTTANLSLRGLQVLGLVLASGYVLVVQVASRTADYDLWGALVVLPVLFVVSAHLLVRAGRTERGNWFLKLLVLVFVLKIVATVIRYSMTWVFFGEGADARGYDREGARLAEHYRVLDFDEDLGRAFVGTGFVRALTGVVYAFTGPSIYVAYAVYASMSFWGLYFIYRAFRTGFPEGEPRRYAVLLLLLPSTLFWPSSLGKDAWMTLGIGLTALGAARLFSHERRWVLPLAAGLAATVAVRPPITAALFAGVAVGMVLRRPKGPSTPVSPLLRIGALVIVMGVGLLIMRPTAEFIGAEEVSTSSVESYTDQAEEQTSQGGSEFEAPSVTSPLDLPWAIVTVICRPLIFEADDARTLIAAAEGTALLGLIALTMTRMRGIVHLLRAYPYLIFCVVYILLFVYGYSNISNFGILTRQRVQVLPLVLVFLALPLVKGGSPITTRHRKQEGVSA